ncbi:MAG: replicative DNA helicase [Candidatus Melainabacteria bacterium]|jgi:replicative DNA helicase|nr:replicative DNA helicase [Candidatus Melainabacteria bacterium]
MNATFQKIDSSLLPFSLEAEQAVLGAVLADAQCLMRVLDLIRNRDFFYKKAHQLIYEGFLRLSEKSDNIDLVTVSEHLKNKNELEEVGGRSYLAELTSAAPVSANAEYYAKIVKEKFTLRSMILAGNRIVELGHHTDEDTEILVDKAEQIIFELAQNKARESLVHIENVLTTSWEQLEERAANKNSLTGLNTGFYDLNSFTSGLQKSDLIILAARPSMGKTALALNIAENVALINRSPVAIFSLEMGKEQLVQRLLCSRAEIDSSRVRTGQLRDDDWAKLGSAMGELGEAPIFIDDSAGVTVMELRGKCRRLKAQHGDLGLVIIDYLQLIEGRSNNDNRVNQMGEISRGLKLLARELNVPIIALSQLSRAVESRQDKRPMLSDLRDSGAIEQDADIVLMIYRDEYYNPETEKAGIADLIIAKQRSGPVGSLELVFQSNITKFKNPARM